MFFDYTGSPTTSKIKSPSLLTLMYHICLLFCFMSYLITIVLPFTRFRTGVGRLLFSSFQFCVWSLAPEDNTSISLYYLPEPPKAFVCVRIEGGVVPAVEVAPDVTQPNVVAGAR